MIFPLILLAVILLYFIVIYKRSYLWINIANIGFDLAILVFYLTIFPYEVSMDREGVNFFTLFGKNRVKNVDIKKIRQASFLTRVTMMRLKYYILTTKKGRDVLKEMFNDFNR